MFEKFSRFSDDLALQAHHDIVININFVCPALKTFNGSVYNGSRPVSGGVAASYNVPGCDFGSDYGDVMGEPPVLDLPAVEFDMIQKIEFYERENKSSLAKIEWRDRNGLHYGGTSQQEGVPVAFGAQESVPVMFNSYPQGGSDIQSPFPNMTRFIRDMAVTSDTHNFDESLRYAYSNVGLLESYNQFFDHKAVAFIRFDRKQLRDLKSCQLQFGIVNRYQYEALRPDLMKGEGATARLYQNKSIGLSTLASGNFSWARQHYTNEESGTWRRRVSMDNLMMIESGLTGPEVVTFMNTTSLGKYAVNVERRLRTQYGMLTTSSKAPAEFTDWMLYASYVNNFQYSAEQVLRVLGEGATWESSH